MVTISYEGKVCSVEAKETVLETLLRNGVAIKNSCRSGVCQSCILKAEKGKPPEKSQQGLKDTLKAQGCFLPCISHPEEDLYISSTTNVQTPVIIVDKKMLNSEVLYLKLKAREEFEFRAGQFVNLIRQNGLARPYSIASLPSDGYLEFHIRVLPGGQMSSWLYSDAKLEEELKIQGPIGDCFYVPDKKEQPLLMVGTSTGLAPLYGILRDALRQGHKGEIHLFHGALKATGLYLMEDLFSLAKEYSHFYYYPSVLQDEKNQQNSLIEIGAIDKLVFHTLKKIKGWRAFLCGHPDLVTSLKKQVFLAGVSLKEIYSDAFLPSIN